MGRRILIVGLALTSALLLYLLLFDGSKGVWLLEALIALFPFALIALAIPSHRGTRRRWLLRWALGLTAALVFSSSLLMQAASTRPRAWTIYRLPLATWCLILGIALVPLLLLGLAYALTFDAGEEEPARRITPGSESSGDS